jgi:serine-type D-Ala-D-Ala carboxypeptidase/endopeptidase (penicillin-binding protein 4)
MKIDRHPLSSVPCEPTLKHVNRLNLHKILPLGLLVPALALELSRPACLAAQSRRAPPWRVRITNAPNAALANRLRPLLDEPPFDRGLWGIAIVDPAGRLVFERNGDRLFVTASAAKIVVAGMAATTLPDDHRFRTTVHAAGPIVGGEVRGDLVLAGYGDPALSGRWHASRFGPLEELADSLRAQGITRVTGDVVGDASYFDSVAVHPAWESYDLAFWYAAPVTALAFNDNTVDVSVIPGTVGGPPVITFAPELGVVQFDNHARTSGPGTRRTFDFYRRPGTNAFWAAGDLPVDARPYDDNLAVIDGAAWTAAAFQRVLANRGITVGGGPRGVYDPAPYAAARARAPLAVHWSPPLEDLLRPILSVSHNWYAEMLLRALGRAAGGRGGWEDGIAAERRFLIDSLGIDSTAFELVDGSGLSHHNLVTPRAFVTILRALREHPRATRFLDALAVPGGVGTLRTRFRYTAPTGRVRAKTGSISNTNTLVGYLDVGGGQYWTYAIQLNNHLLSNRDVLRRIDAIVAAIR